VPGEFSRRGGILDVFSPSAKHPARIEFFGDEVESIRLFTPEDQRSIGQVDSYEIILRSGSGSEFLESGDFSEYLKDWSPYLIPVFPQVLRTQVERFSPEALDQ
jgi:transcription-repair coupling factor (superfamily II helicase)